IDDDDSLPTLRVVAVGREITEATKAEAQRRMEQYHLSHYRLTIIQGIQSDSLLSLTNQLSQMAGNSSNEHKQLLELTAEASMLHQQLSDYTRYEALTPDVLSEMTTLFPQVSSLSLANNAEAHLDTTDITRFVVALIQTKAAQRLSPDESRHLRQWLQKRVKADSLIVVQK
ncbi:MAG: TIGR00341 family protein, partial [Bacteroidaceae bacterium]|nr:TIGR00341 family protein [Bacteroidaceae bacterium]